MSSSHKRQQTTSARVLADWTDTGDVVIDNLAAVAKMTKESATRLSVEKCAFAFVGRTGAGKSRLINQLLTDGDSADAPLLSKRGAQSVTNHIFVMAHEDRLGYEISLNGGREAQHAATLADLRAALGAFDDQPDVEVIRCVGPFPGLKDTPFELIDTPGLTTDERVTAQVTEHLRALADVLVCVGFRFDMSSLADYPDLFDATVAPVIGVSVSPVSDEAREDGMLDGASESMKQALLGRRSTNTPAMLEQTRASGLVRQARFIELAHLRESMASLHQAAIRARKDIAICAYKCLRVACTGRKTGIRGRVAWPPQTSLAADIRDAYQLFMGTFHLDDPFVIEAARYFWASQETPTTRQALHATIRKASDDFLRWVNRSEWVERDIPDIEEEIYLVPRKPIGFDLSPFPSSSELPALVDDKYYVNVYEDSRIDMRTIKHCVADFGSKIVVFAFMSSETRQKLASRDGLVCKEDYRLVETETPAGKKGDLEVDQVWCLLLASMGHMFDISAHPDDAPWVLADDMLTPCPKEAVESILAENALHYQATFKHALIDVAGDLDTRHERGNVYELFKRVASRRSVEKVNDMRNFAGWRVGSIVVRNVLLFRVVEGRESMLIRRK